MTDGERRLWLELKTWRSARGIHVRKQAPIGPFVADFAIHAAKLVIEVDGEHHATASGLQRDANRDAWFVSQGYRVFRVTTGEITELLEGCLERIFWGSRKQPSKQMTPTLYPSPQGRDGQDAPFRTPSPSVARRWALDPGLHGNREKSMVSLLPSMRGDPAVAEFLMEDTLAD